MERSLKYTDWQTRDFQKSFEDADGKYVPCRAVAAMAYSGIQRAFISLSNCFFRYDCFPTNYGSSVAYAPRERGLYRLPSHDPKAQDDKMAEFFKRLSDFSESYPDVRFVVYIVPATDSRLNPVLNLTSRALTYESVKESAIRRTDRNSNVVIMGSDAESSLSYFDRFYRSDHHWTVRGCVEAYNEVAEVLGLNPCGNIFYEVSEYSFYGSNSRIGLIPVADSVEDIQASFADLRLIDGDGSDVGFAGLKSRDWLSSFDYYESHYNNLISITDGCVIDNAEPASNANCILVCDSYGALFQRLLAANYQTTFVSRVPTLEWKSMHSLSEAIDEIAPRDIVLLASSSGFARVLENCPQFFSRAGSSGDAGQ